MLFFPKKIWFPLKTLHQICISDEKSCQLIGKLGKHIKSITCLCLHGRQNPAVYFQTWNLARSKTRACLLRFLSETLTLKKSLPLVVGDLSSILRSCSQMHIIALFSWVYDIASFNSHLCSISFIFRHISFIFFVGLPVLSISAIKDFVFGYIHSMHVALRSYSRHQSLVAKINLNRNRKHTKTLMTIFVIFLNKMITQEPLLVVPGAEQNENLQAYHVSCQPF